MRIVVALSFLALCFMAFQEPDRTNACCTAFALGKPVVNADQTVIILWDGTNKTQHFIRQASFKSDADDFGFLVPSPTQPQLEESGNEAFPFLAKLTEPEKRWLPRRIGMGCGCSAAMPARDGESLSGSWVKVLEEKRVAGFNAAVLETDSTSALVKWLKDNGYHFSPEVEAWARPYVDAGWKITALKVAKDKEGEGQAKKDVAASSLRISFKTEQPLFPYRESDYKGINEKLGAKSRLLRIYFLAEARYEGTLTKERPWTGKAVWAGKLSKDDRMKILEAVKLPATTGPADWWLTEFEDNWPYKVAPADVYFSRSADQSILRRPRVDAYAGASIPNDGATYALAIAIVMPPIWMRLRRRWKMQPVAA